MVVGLLASPLRGLALECPAMPQQSQRDTDMAVAIAVSRIGQASGTQLQAQTREVTTDLLTRLPRADRVYLEQMMYATYCTSLRDNAKLTEAERSARLQAYNRELRATLYGSPQPASPKVDPRDAARAELARIPVEYSPAAFVRSAEDGKIAVVRLFLQAGIDPSSTGRDGVTALMHAAGRGDLPMMEMLLKAGAAVNARTRSGGIALTWAAAAGQLAAMRLLVKSGASRDSFDQVLMVALRWGELDAFRLMLEYGANPRADDRNVGSRLASIPRSRLVHVPELLKILLQRGWPIDAGSQDGQTALMYAANDNNLELMRLLLNAGADVNVHCECKGILSGGHSALTLATSGGHEKAVVLLLDAGAVVDAPSKDGTPLMIAAERDSRALVKLLLAKGADVNKARNGKGDTALMHAAFREPDNVAQLLAAGADVNAKAPNGATALMWAAEGDKPKIATALLDAGADLEAKTQRGRTALMIAAMRGSVDTARLLIQRGARTDVLDEDNRSALAHASERLEGEDRARMLALLGRKESK